MLHLQNLCLYSIDGKIKLGEHLAKLSKLVAQRPITIAICEAFFQYSALESTHIQFHNFHILHIFQTLLTY